MLTELSGFQNGPSPSWLRWQAEGEKHQRAGDTAWMAAQLMAGLRPAGGECRVLEIGCGPGYSTLALCQAGALPMVVEPSTDAIALTEARLREADALPGGAAPIFLQVMLQAGVGVPEELRQQMTDFAPEAVVCWLMGADETMLDASLPAAQAVKVHREAAHRAVAELATALPSVQAIHLVDRSAFPWKIKETARETLQLYHHATTFAGLPWAIERADTLYRKLDQRQWPMPAPPRGAAASGAVPVLGALIARRTAVAS